MHGYSYRFGCSQYVHNFIVRRTAPSKTEVDPEISWLGIISIGGFVAMVELPCTGGPYLAVTAILAKSFDIQAFFYLLAYNFIFILPLLIIFILLYYGTSATKLKLWRQKNRK